MSKGVHLPQNKENSFSNKESGHLNNKLRKANIKQLQALNRRFRQSEEKFKNLAENSPNMIFINKKGGVAYANKKCEDLMGYKQKEFYSPDFDFLSLIAPESLNLIKSSFGKHMKGQEVKPYEYTLLSKTGNRIEAIITTRLIKYDGSTAILGIITDITKRKRAEEATRAERDKAKKYLDLAGVIMLAIDNKGKVTLINRKGADVLGWKEKEIIGKNWFENFLPKRLSKPVFSVFNQLLANEVKPVEYHENPVLTKNGEERLIAWHNTVLKGKDGKIIGTLSSGEDITEKKKAEQEAKMWAKREAEEASKYKECARNAGSYWRFHRDFS